MPVRIVDPLLRAVLGDAGFNLYGELALVLPDIEFPLLVFKLVGLRGQLAAIREE